MNTGSLLYRDLKHSVKMVVVSLLWGEIYIVYSKL